MECSVATKPLYLTSACVGNQWCCTCTRTQSLNKMAEGGVPDLSALPLRRLPLERWVVNQEADLHFSPFVTSLEVLPNLQVLHTKHDSTTISDMAKTFFSWRKIPLVRQSSGINFPLMVDGARLTVNT